MNLNQAIKALAPEIFKDDKRFIKNFTLYNIAQKYVEDTDVLVKYILKKDKNVFKELLTTEKYFVGHNGNNKEYINRISRLMNQSKANMQKC